MVPAPSCCIFRMSHSFLGTPIRERRQHDFRLIRVIRQHMHTKLVRAAHAFVHGETETHGSSFTGL